MKFIIFWFDKCRFVFELPVECIESIATATVNLLEVIRFMGGGISFSMLVVVNVLGTLAKTPRMSRPLFQPLSLTLLQSLQPFGKFQLTAVLTICSVALVYFLIMNLLRPKRFVTQKIVQSALLISKKKLTHVELGNLDGIEIGDGPQIT